MNLTRYSEYSIDGLFHIHMIISFPFLLNKNIHRFLFLMRNHISLYGEYILCLGIGHPFGKGSSVCTENRYSVGE